MFHSIHIRFRWKVISLLVGVSIFGFLVSIGICFLLVQVHQELSEQWLMTSDQIVQNGVHAWSSPFMTSIMLTLTTIANPVGLLAISVLVVGGLFLSKRWFEGTGFLLTVGGAAVLNQVAKYWFQRPLPMVAWALEHEETFSFPSGHAMMSLAFNGMFAYLLFLFLHRFPRARMLMVLGLIGLVGGIGLSRIYVGAHYPSDVLASFLASGIWVCASMMGTEVGRRLLPRRSLAPLPPQSAVSSFQHQQVHHR